jgi:predicted transcriptional regulator
MISLSDNQKKVLLQLGGNTCFEMVPSDILNELLSLGIIFKRSDGKYDLTEIGEQTYHTIKKTGASPSSH